MPTSPNLGFFQEYWFDAWQRSILMLDTLRERGNIYLEQSDKEAPNVLGFAVEVVRDGRTLPQPVNYVLVRIVPPEGTRSKTRYWKTGFYYIAVTAGVPIIMAYMDYAQKRSGLGPLLQPSGDIEADMVAVRIGGEQRMITVGAPDYLVRRPPPAVPEDLAAHECVRYRYLSSGRTARWMFRRDGRTLEVDVGGDLVDIDGGRHDSHFCGRPVRARP